MLRRTKNRIALLAVMLLTLTGVSACSSSDAGSSQLNNANPKVVKIGWIPSVNFIALLNTIDQWKSPDSKIELVEFKSSADTLVAINQGAVDIATVGYSVFADGMSKAEMPLEYIAGVSTKGAFIVGRKGAGIKNWEDLKGKKVGGVRGSPEYLHLVGAMEAHGVVVGKDAEFVNFQSGSDLILALQKGEIDAAVSYEPLVSAAVLKGSVVRLPEMQKTLMNQTFELSSGILARKAFVNAHNAWTVSFLKAYAKSVDKFATNPEPKQAAKTYLKYSAGDPAVIAEAVGYITAVYDLNEQQVRRVGKTLLTSGQLKKDMSQMLVDHLDYGPLSKATGKAPRQLGKSD